MTRLVASMASPLTLFHQGFTLESGQMNGALQAHLQGENHAVRLVMGDFNRTENMFNQGKSDAATQTLMGEG